MLRLSNRNFSLVDQALVSGVNFLSGIILARFLGLSEYGFFVLLWMLVLFLNSIQNALIMTPMMSVRPETYKVDNTQFYSSFISLQALFSLFSLIISSAILFILYSQNWNGIKGEILIPFVSAAIFFQLQDFYRRYFFSRELYKDAFISDLISYFGQIILLFILAYLEIFSLENALLAIAATSLIAIIYSLFKAEKIQLNPKEFLSLLKRNWLYSKWLVATSVMQWLSGHFFIFVTGFVMGALAVGAVRSALNIIGVVHILFQGLENVVPVKAAKLYLYSGIVIFKKYVVEISVFTFIGTLALSIPILLFPELIMKLLYGEEFIKYSYLLYWCVGTYLVLSLSLPLKVALRTLENTRAIFVAQFISATFTVMISYIFVVYMGLEGLMLGIFMINIVFVGVLLYSYMKELAKVV